MNVKFSIIIFLLLSTTLRAQDIAKIELPQEFKTVLTNYETHWQNGNEASLASLFTEDGFILRPGHPLVKGREAIEQAYKNAKGMLVLSAYDFGVDGELAYIIGGYAGHESWPDSGKFTLVLKKVNGKWLIHSDMDNGNQHE